MALRTEHDASTHGVATLAARRALAVPLLLVGGVIFVATAVAAIGGGLYYTYVGLRTIFADGDVGQGILITLVAPMALTFIMSILAIPGNALLALGTTLWGGD